jgi:DNA repair and recombination RAD54-like protein
VPRVAASLSLVRVVRSLARDAYHAVMIVSYETLRTLQDELAKCPIGLLLADEGHRLKNSGESSILSG